MNLIDQIKGASGRDLELLIFGAAGVISPGLLTIWYFAPEFYTTVSTLKLLLTALALTTPFVALNSLLIVFRPIGLRMRQLTSDDEGFSIAVTFAAMFNALVGSLLFLVAYLASLALSTFVYVVIGAELLFALIFLRFGRRQDK